ncbi:hypothetical protein TNCV_1924531 [Trichonephila clavipes]|nr:hypothetical protein TNCV_1924531 [Trichonephila clavipes]
MLYHYFAKSQTFIFTHVLDLILAVEPRVPLVRLVEGEERCEAPDHPQVSFLKIEWKRAKSYRHPFVLKVTANDRRHLAFAMMNFVDFDSAPCRSSGISNNNRSTSLNTPVACYF